MQEIFSHSKPFHKKMGLLEGCQVFLDGPKVNGNISQEYTIDLYLAGISPTNVLANGIIGLYKRADIRNVHRETNKTLLGTVSDVC